MDKFTDRYKHRYVYLEFTTDGFVIFVKRDPPY